HLVLAGAAPDRHDGRMLEQDDGVGNRALQDGGGQRALQLPGLGIRRQAETQQIGRTAHTPSLSGAARASATISSQAVMLWSKSPRSSSASGVSKRDQVSARQRQPSA